MKKERGVTLIVLVVTVMIIIIIAGVIVGVGLGQKGQVKEIISATEQSFHDNVKDALLILQTDYTSKEEYVEYLKEHNYLNSDGQVEVKTLLKSVDCEYGIGKEKNDVYILTDDLNLTYYDKNGNAKELGNLGATMEE